MLVYNSDKVKTITICGSFRKHYKEIIEVIEIFEERGFVVLSPKKSEILNPNEEFVIFKDDETTDPSELENIHLDAIKKADIIYVCDFDGYIGFSTAMELGYAINYGHLIYFYDKPNEIIFDKLCNLDNRVVKPNELCLKLEITNSIADIEYFDSDHKRKKSHIYKKLVDTFYKFF